MNAKQRLIHDVCNMVARVEDKFSDPTDANMTRKILAYNVIIRDMIFEKYFDVDKEKLYKLMDQVGEKIEENRL